MPKSPIDPAPGGPSSSSSIASTLLTVLPEPKKLPPATVDLMGDAVPRKYARGEVGEPPGPPTTLVLSSALPPLLVRELELEVLLKRREKDEAGV